MRSWIALSFVFLAPAARSAQTCSTEQVSFGPGGIWTDGPSSDAVLSQDGRFVAFASTASVFVGATPGQQVYLFDRASGTTELITVALGGGASSYSTGPAYCWPVDISSDGRFVSFVS